MHLRVPLHPAWHNHPRRRQSLLRRTSGPKHRARRGCLSRGASHNLGVGHSPPPSLTQLAERPSPTLGEREKDPDRDRKAAFSTEEAGVASPVRGGVELVAQEDSDRDTELTVVSSLFRTRRQCCMRSSRDRQATESSGGAKTRPQHRTRTPIEIMPTPRRQCSTPADQQKDQRRPRAASILPEPISRSTTSWRE
jgi:hypothetical protein